jgi:proteasome accessory factor B
MDRTERLLDLIAIFLDARDPVAWAEIREAFPDDYGKGAPEACARKFERDKADLAELGVSLEFLAESEDRKGGYRLRDGYYLPQVDFSPEEAAVLFAAGSAALASGAFPGSGDLSHALRKLAFASPEDLRPGTPRLYAELEPAGEGMGERLESLWQALLARKRVRLLYKGIGRGEETEREVDPWALCLRRGVWVLVGWCHLREAERTFLVDRIVAVEVNPKQPRSPDYELPEGFHVSKVAAEQVWEQRFHAPVEVSIDLSAELAPLAGRLFPNARVEPDGPGAKLTVTATYLDGLLRRVLPLGEGAVVTGPERAVERMRQMAQAVLARHAAGTEAA